METASGQAEAPVRGSRSVVGTGEDEEDAVNRTHLRSCGGGVDPCEAIEGPCSCWCHKGEAKLGVEHMPKERPGLDDMRELAHSPWARLWRAARNGTGCRLSVMDVRRLAGDGALMWRGEKDAKGYADDE